MNVMIIKKILFLYFPLFFDFEYLCAISLVEQFKQVGYTEIIDRIHETATFDALYASFDTFIEFIQKNPIWVQKLYIAKERFIRSKNRNYYSTDIFGLYDESKKAGRSQISFYYSIHFHEFISMHYPEFNRIPEIINFLQICYEIQEPYKDIFDQAAFGLGLKTIFDSEYGRPPILFKVIKYLPGYITQRPHYDGTAFSLFLDSTDNQSLLVSAYKPLLGVDDFFVPKRKFSRGDHANSILLIPGTFLAEFSIYPTPHIVVPSGKTRYAAIAFAMRPHYIYSKQELSTLPSFIIE